MLGTITKGEYKNDPLPDNVYLAKLLNVKEKQPPKDHQDWNVQLSWAFEILVPPFAKRRAWGKTPCSWIAGKKLDLWLQTLGINVPKGTSVKIEDLKDLYVKILVKNRKYQDKETSEDKYFPEVKELLPLDSLDQIKIRELIAGVPAAATPAQPVAPAPVVVTATHTVTPPLQPNVSVPVGGTFVPTQPTFTPAPSVTVPSGAPSRTIPF